MAALSRFGERDFHYRGLIVAGVLY